MHCDVKPGVELKRCSHEPDVPGLVGANTAGKKREKKPSGAGFHSQFEADYSDENWGYLGVQNLGFFDFFLNYISIFILR